MKNEGAIRKIETEQGTFCYLLYRKSVKNINLRIRADGSVCVSANRRVPLSFLDAFVRDRLPFIRRAQKEYEQAKKKRQRTYADGEELSFLGTRLRIVIREEGGEKKGRKKENVVRVEDQLILTVPEHASVEERERLVHAWYKREAETLLPLLCEQIYAGLDGSRIPYPQIKIRRMTSRWGSCQPQKRIITLSTMLLEAPVPAVEYVIVHEFMHFLQPNHSAAFYRLVEQVLPDWRERKALLPRR